jgi:hypothetical protein
MHVSAENKKERRTMSARCPSADESFGRLLSWVAGKDKTASGGSSTDRAAGRLFSWIVGKKSK